MNNIVTSVVGQKGSGKSTLVKEMIEDYPRVVVFDTMGEYKNSIEGFDNALREISRVRNKRRFKIALRIVEDENALRALAIVYDDLPRSLVVVEETSFYCSPSYLPIEIKRFVRYGRHREISQIYVSRRPAEIHRDLTAQSDLIVSFRQHEPADIEYLRRVMGPAAMNLPNLPKYHCLVSGDIDMAPLPLLERIAKGEAKLAGDFSSLTGGTGKK